MVMGWKARHSITPRFRLPGDGNLPGMDGDVSATKNFDRSAVQALVGLPFVTVEFLKIYVMLFWLFV